MQYGTIIVGVAGWTMHVKTTCRLQERNIKINKFKIHFLTLDVFPLYFADYTRKSTWQCSVMQSSPQLYNVYTAFVYKQINKMKHAHSFACAGHTII